MNIEEKLATAIAAANEFKYMLDIQRPGTLYYPGRKKIDPRNSFCYKKAAEDLLQLTLQVHDGSQSPAGMLPHIKPASEGVANHGADADSRPANVLADAIVALAKLGIDKVSNDGDGSKDSGLFVFGVCSLGSFKKIAKLANGESAFVHKTS